MHRYTTPSQIRIEKRKYNNKNNSLQTSSCAAQNEIKDLGSRKAENIRSERRNKDGFQHQQFEKKWCEEDRQESARFILKLELHTSNESVTSLV
jgi:hypothetical protein